VDFVLVRHFACMVLFTMGNVMLFGSGLVVRVLSEAGRLLVVRLLVAGMRLLVAGVGLGQLVDVVDATDL